MKLLSTASKMKTTDNNPKKLVHTDPVSLVHSIQCLVMLVERHPNHPTSCLYLCLVSKALALLEAQFASLPLTTHHQYPGARAPRQKRTRKTKI